MGVNATRPGASNVPAKSVTSVLCCRAFGQKRRSQIIHNIAAPLASCLGGSSLKTSASAPPPNCCNINGQSMAAAWPERRKLILAPLGCCSMLLNFRIWRGFPANPSAEPRLTAQVLAERFADLNEGLTSDAIIVKTTDKGWLDEVRICLGRNFKPRQCPQFSRLARDKTQIKIWRGR